MGLKLLLAFSIVVPAALSCQSAWLWWEKDDGSFLWTSAAMLSVAIMGCVVYARSLSENS